MKTKYADLVCIKQDGKLVKKWLCPNVDCGLPVSMSDTSCPHCGQNIKFKEDQDEESR